MDQFTYRDKQTGQTKDFDHEPSEQELHQAFSGGDQPHAPVAQGGDERGLLSKFLTGIAAPAAGTILGGAVGGPIGAGIGAMGGKGFGDAAAALLGDKEAIQKDPVEEMLDLSKTGAGTVAFSAASPLLSKVPGPPSLRNIGIGAGSGYLIGKGVDHPAWGAAAGGALGGWALLSGLLRGAGGIGEAISTPRFGPQSIRGVHMPGTGVAAEGAAGAEAAAGGEYADALRKAGVGEPAINAATRGRSTMTPTPNGAPKAPTPPGMPTSAQVNPTSTPTIRPRVSTEVPYQAPGEISTAEAGGLYRQEPGPLETMLGVPKAKNPRIGRNEMPNLSNSPNLRYGAEITTPGDYVNPQVEQTAPSEAPWEDIASRVQPKRTSTKGGTYSVSRTPEEALKNLKVGQTNPEPPTQVNDLPNGAPKGNVGKAKTGTTAASSVDEAEGLSAQQQGLWERYKATHPGTTDADLDTWYHQQGFGADPNAGMDVNGLIDKLRSILPKSPRK